MKPYEIKQITKHKYLFTTRDMSLFKKIDDALSIYDVPKDKINIVNNMLLFRSLLERFIVDIFVNEIKVEPNTYYIIQVNLPDDQFVLYMRDNQDVENNVLKGISYGVILNENIYTE